MPSSSAPKVSLTVGSNSSLNGSRCLKFEDNNKENQTKHSKNSIPNSKPKAASNSKSKRKDVTSNNSQLGEVSETTLAQGNVPLYYNLKKRCNQLKHIATNNLNNIQPSQAELRRGGLYAGSCFTGHQRSGKNCYEVNVKIQNVDLNASFMCGFLQIKGLTDEFPDFSTYFEAEIIGPKHDFLTRKWDAAEAEDLQHWSKFSSFKPYETCFNDDKFDHGSIKTDNFIFMRWKAHDHKIKSLNGASYAGFYYICFDLNSQSIEGYYFHQNSEWFQHLVLQHIPDKACSSFEFR